MNSRPLVEIENLTHSYNGRPALRGVGFSVSAGEIFGILGPNGGGKTTLFRILATLLQADGGHARVGGCDVAQQPQQVRRLLGVVFQSPSVDGKLTVAENLQHQGRLHGLHRALLEQRLTALLQRFGLQERRRELVENLSGGLRRRVELAKSLLHQPALLLLDEPSTGLDPGARRELWDLLRHLQISEGVTVLLTTHLLEEAEKCDRLAILDAGRLVALGTPEELKARIGGDVIMLDSPQPELLRMRCRELFQIEATVVDGRLRLERDRGHEFVPKLIEAFPGRITSLTIGKPTLEDVFIKETGHQFWRDKAAERG
ncbi:MAG: ATP-binding cassette domain-containing protein [candidate division KSB1 bacterium]|nr:ATP-binding cassette domain-containing protein [candidate division KSB1 bacterium]MDZ7274920.1 ATP-binding cassette domain-containing protein [candidate division KSB1 bacterium]MDZ7286628.1 ATP-binding cassette domain-containing protein [candidate division KSB1 bacterium]MDZ7299209.1 ATP-binding cassette domain-containing protein [candidate division KSB1 bacterium]MDZ7309156.1 ATP-binding cassette domain-containing protein [candidate division KSB1 bacterium]